MYNQEAFKHKLDFIVRQFHSIGNNTIKEYGEDKASTVMNIFWEKSVELLWQTRESKRVFSGIDNRADYETFSSYLTLAINQFNKKICTLNLVYKEDFVKRILEFNKMVKEFVNDTVIELEELLNKSTSTKH